MQQARIAMWSGHQPASIILVAAALLHVSRAAHADASPRATLSVGVVELRTNDGQVGCALYESERGFPKDRNAAVQTKWCDIVDLASSCVFEPVRTGTYAVACFHDENHNLRLDTGIFGIPKEGVVASNHAKGFMGPPKFKDAKLSLPEGATELRLKMRY